MDWTSWGLLLRIDCLVMCDVLVKTLIDEPESKTVSERRRRRS